MALQFNPPQDLINAYLNRPSPGQQASDAINQALQTYVLMKQKADEQALLKQGMDLKTAEAARQGEELALKKKEHFYNYADTSVLPPDVQASIGQPVQGPPNYIPPENVPYETQRTSVLGDQQGPVQPTGLAVPPQAPSLIQRYNEFISNFPQGIKGQSMTSDTIVKPDGTVSIVQRPIKGKTIMEKSPLDSKRTFQKKQTVYDANGKAIGYRNYNTATGEETFQPYKEGEIPEGGSLGPSVLPTISSADAEFFAKGKMLSQVFDQVDKHYKDSYVGPVAGRAGRALDVYTPFGNEERSTLRNYVAKAFNNLIYLRSGKQIAQEEAVRMAEEFMSINNTPIAFKSAIGSMKQEMKWLVNNRKEALQAAGYRNIEKMETGIDEKNPQSLKKSFIKPGEEAEYEAYKKSMSGGR